MLVEWPNGDLRLVPVFLFPHLLGVGGRGKEQLMRARDNVRAVEGVFTRFRIGKGTESVVALTYPPTESDRILS